ncbi:AAA family ATPase [Dokdonella sp. MW10]|uniref:AAA family ATPase n=1 Tax=Dokdonella sp. MW10 TaxID=2992926 RepID=UPI003F7D9672
MRSRDADLDEIFGTHTHLSDFGTNPFGSKASARASRLKPVRIASAIGREAALYALRMIQKGKWHAKLLERGRFRDEDVLALVGFEWEDQGERTSSAAELREAFTHQAARLEASAGKQTGVLHRNIERFASIIGLSGAERIFLRFCIVASEVGQISDLFRLAISSQKDFVSSICAATGLRQKEVLSATSRSSSLRRSGLLEHWGVESRWREEQLVLSATVIDALTLPRLDEAALLRNSVRNAPKSKLRLTDYTHVEELPLLESHLRHAVTQRRSGVNILIHGKSGTGKTELARTVASAVGARLHEVSNEDRDGSTLSGSARMSAYQVCQSLLARQQGSLLLFDEVEDVFGGEGDLIRSLFGRDAARSGMHKSRMNDALEQNAVPAFWTCNSIAAIDPAHLRRFDLVIELGSPPRSVRRGIVDRYFRKGEISQACADRIAANDLLAPANVERIAHVARSMPSTCMQKRDATAERLVRSAIKAAGGTPPIMPAAADEHYDMAFLNTDVDTAAIVRAVHSGVGARLCLHGPPGSGKTAFAHHLAQLAGKQALVKRGSDLISKWIGETETLIAGAFAQARNEDAILVIDEADGFLRDRSSAHRGWEVTQVNELLTQMEAFEGIFIATTNFMDGIDAAAMRRFDFKIRFDCMTRTQRRTLLARMSTGVRVADAVLEALDRLDALTPGDFANVGRQLRLLGEEPRAYRIVELLQREAAHKPEGRRSPMGFVA